MEAVIIDLDVLSGLTESRQTCYILCGRDIDEDCKKDMGLSCQLYDATFKQMYAEHAIGEDDPDAWEPHEESPEEDSEEEEEEDDTDSDCEDCDEEIEIKVKGDSVSSLYADE